MVPSAPGKRNSADTKVTDMLYDCYRTAVAGRDFKKKLQNIKARYQEIVDGLNLSLDLSPEFEKSQKTLPQQPERTTPHPAEST